MVKHKICASLKGSKNVIFTFSKRVYGYECDVYGHMNNANYLQLLECARAEAMIEMGMSITRLKELDLQIFVTGFELDYIKALQLEDTVTVKSSFFELNRVKGRWHQEVYNSTNVLCFTATMRAVFARQGKPIRLPQEVFSLFQGFIEAQE